MAKAACVDLMSDEDGVMDPNAVDVFFVDAGHQLPVEVQRTCETCPVREQCLEYSYTGFEGHAFTSGYFGGLPYGQRRGRSFQEALELIRSTTPTRV